MTLQYTEEMVCVTRRNITEIQMVHYVHFGTACYFLIGRLQVTLNLMPHISQYSRFPASIPRYLHTFWYPRWTMEIVPATRPVRISL